MNLLEEKENLIPSIFQPGFPKKIYWPHFNKSRIFHDNKGKIISVVTKKYQPYIYFNNLDEQILFCKNNCKKLKKFGVRWALM